MLPGIVGSQQVLLNHTNNTLMDVIRSLNMEGGLKLVLDASDGLSYPGSGQTIIDRTGTQNFNIGATSGSEASDLSWTGVVDRRSSAEYFYSTGVPQYSKAPALPSYMNAIHQDGARFAMAGWIWAVNYPSGGGLLMMNTSITATGFVVGTQVDAHPQAGRMVFVVVNGGVVVAEVMASGNTPFSQWSFWAIRVDEAASTYTMWINSTKTTGAITYVSPSAGAASFTPNWGDNGTGTRMANVAVWQGATIPSVANIDDLFTRTRTKFGV